MATTPLRRPPPIQTVNIPTLAVPSPAEVKISVTNLHKKQTHTPSHPLTLLYPPEFDDTRYDNPPISLWNDEEMAAKARELLHKLLQNSVPTGNLYSGGLGSYYLLLEYCDFLEATAAANSQKKPIGNSTTTPSPSTRIRRASAGPIHAFAYNNNKQEQPSSPLTESPLSSSPPTCVLGTPSSKSNMDYSPIRCKRLIQQALDATKQALKRFNNTTHQRNHKNSNKHNKLTTSSLSILENDWMGAHVLHAVCLMRLERLQNKLDKQQSTKKNATPLKKMQPKSSSLLYSPSKVPPSPPPPPPPPPRSSLTTPTKSFLYKTATTTTSTTPSPSRKPSVEKSQSHTATTPPYQPVLDKLLHRLQLIHNPDLSRNVFYNYDVLGGRAGALQLIWWIRKEMCKNNVGGDENESSLWAQDVVVALVTDMIQQGLATAKQLRQQSAPELPSDVLVWVCDSHGTHKYYLHAARGVVGILHTLLALHDDDWKLVEKEIPQARQYLRNSIDLFAHGLTLQTPEQNENDSCKGNIDNEHKTRSFEEMKKTDDVTTTNAFGVSRRHDCVKSQKMQAKRQQIETFRKHIFFEDGNLRPFLDAPNDLNTVVDWFQGATGLSMLLLQASQVFNSKEYLLAAHTLCDSVIFQKGMEMTTETTIRKEPETNSRLAWRSNSSHHRRTLYNLSSPTNDDSKNKSIGGRTHHDCVSIHDHKGPAGMACMAFTFLMLSKHCSNAPPTSENKTALSLQRMWKNRAIHLAQRAQQEWMSHLETVPLATCGRNTYSLYEGMGCLASLWWQLASPTQSCGNTPSARDPQLPFYAHGLRSSVHGEKMNTAFPREVKILPPKEKESLPQSPPSIRRTLMPKASPQCSLQQTSVKPELTQEEEAECRRKKAKEKLLESRKRRAKAEKEALRRKTMEEETRKKKVEEEKERKSLEEKRRKVQLEARKHLQVVSRKMATIKIQEDAKRKDEELAKKKAADKAKREAMLLARKQAQDRVEAQRKIKEEKEQRRAEELEKKRKAEIAAKQAEAEAESTKRKEMAEQIRKAKKEEAELAKEKEQERIRKDREEAKQRQEELRQREEQRIQRNEERRRRMAQVLAQAEVLKKHTEEERVKWRMEQEEQRREKEKQRLFAAEEQRKRREELVKKKAAAEKQRAREKARREKELEELKFKKQLEKALKLEEGRQKMREKQRRRDDTQAKRLLEEMLKKEKSEKERSKRIAEVNRKKEAEAKTKQQHGVVDIRSSQQPIQQQTSEPQSTDNKAISSDEKPHPKVMKQKMNPSHFSLPTRPSMFWSLQSDSKIGASEDYNIALVNESEVMEPSNENAAVASSSHFVAIQSADLSRDNAFSDSAKAIRTAQPHTIIAQKSATVGSIPLVASIPRRRKGVNASKRIQSLSKIVQGTLELKKQL